MDEWVKMRYIYTMEYFSAIKTNGIVPYVIPWSALEYIILSEISRIEKDKHRMISLTCGI